MKPSMAVSFASLLWLPQASHGYQLCKSFQAFLSLVWLSVLQVFVAGSSLLWLSSCLWFFEVCCFSWPKQAEVGNNDERTKVN